jgi:phosphohistidine phosphatase
MKRIVIVRHAKAVPYGYHDDFFRELQDRGRNDADIVSKELAKTGIKPDAIITSPAKRALKTAKIFAKNLEFDKDKIEQNSDIYEGINSSEFIDLIRELPDDLNTVFFFGHNPGFHFFVSTLLPYYNDDMPTCATIGIKFNCKRWEEVKAHAGVQEFRLIPRMFRA